MQKDNFQELLRALNIQVVVFVDDDFTPVTKPQSQLICFCKLSENEFHYALGVLKNHGFHELAECLAQFREKFIKIELTTEDNTWLAAEEMKRMPSMQNNQELILELDKICSELQKQAEIIQELTMNLGLANSLENYDELINIAKSSTSVKVIRLYKALEGEAFNEFTSYTTQIIQDSPGKLMLAIVDKVLGGKEIGQEIIKGFRQAPVVKGQMLSVIYTSQIAAASSTEGLDKFFDIQLEKTTATRATLSEKIATCAFVLMLEKIIKARTNALEETQKLVAAEGISNILYVASMAHVEGITAHYAIDHWVELFSSKVAADLLYLPPSGFKSICGLSGLLNENFFPKSEKPSGPFAKHLHELRSFELFNTHVNALHSPPTAGDIFQIGNQLYILAGQDCDLIVRNQSGGLIERKEKIAELVKAEFIPGHLDSKFEPVGTDSASLKVNYFLFEDKEGHLQINFNQRDNIDFRVLDLCSFNENGESSFFIDSDIPQYIIDLMPRMWQDYSTSLFQDVKAKIQIAELITNNNISSRVMEGDISFNLKTTTAYNRISFPIKRLSRIKGQMKDVFLQRFYQYKTRKATDTILVHNQKEVTCSSLKSGFAFNITPCEKRPDKLMFLLSTDREKNNELSNLELVLNLDSLVDYLPDQLQRYLRDIAKREIVFLGDFHIEHESLIKFKRKINGSEVELEITLPISNQYTGKHIQPLQNNMFTLNEILGDNMPLDSISNYSLNGEIKSFKTISQLQCIPQTELQKGIDINGVGKITFDRDNGILNVIPHKNGNN